jgi:hypothetical protein
MEHQSPQPPPDRPLSRGKVILLALYPPLAHFMVQLVIMIAVTAAFMLPPIIGAAMQGGDALQGDDFLEAFLPQITIYSLLISSVVSAVMFYFLYRFHKRDFSITPLFPTSFPMLTVVIALAGNFAVLAAVTAIQEVLDTDFPTSTLDGIIDAIPLPLLLLTVCVIVPIAEELCFRGLMLNQLSRAFSFWTANIMQAAVFGLIHGTPIQIAYAFFFGLLLGWMQRRTGQIKTVIIAHMVFNSAFFPLGFIPGIEQLMEDPGRLVLLIFLPSIAVTLFGIRFFDSATSKSIGRM